MDVAEISDSPIAKRVFAIFQGGGAKGIAHVGAYSAMEDSNIALSGVAGTSAGAIMAALVSAGYTSQEIYDIDSHGNVIERINRNYPNEGNFLPARGPKDLFGSSGWASIMVARWASSHWKMISELSAVLLIFGLIDIYIKVVEIGVYAIGLLIFLGVLLLVFCIRGFARLDRFSLGLDQVLKGKINAGDGGEVTFKTLQENGGIPLCIVASDIRRQSVKLFNAERTPHVKVSDAVAASACLPMVFSPKQIDGDTFYDGGLVSNLPAWVFDEERVLDKNASTVTCEIADTRQIPSGPITGLEALLKAASTGIFGTGTLDKRAVSNLFSVTLTPSVGLLDFNMTHLEAKNAIVSAKDDCAIQVVYPLVTLPITMTEICSRASFGALDFINQARKKEELAPLSEELRVSVALPAPGTSKTLHLAYSYGFDGSSDEGIFLPIASSFVGQAWQKEESLFVERDNPQWNRILNRPEDQAIRRLIDPSLRWVYAIAHVDSQFPSRKLILAIDGKEDLGLSAEGARRMLKALNSEIQRALNETVPEEVYR